MSSVAPDNQAQQAPEAKTNDKEYNFRQLEKRLDQERHARVAAEERASEAERIAQERSKSRDDDEDDGSEPYVDHKRLEKKLAKFEKSMDQKIEEKAEAKARTLFESERKNSYLKENADFNQVMGSDTVQKFADKHPRLAENILRMPEGFERQKLVYESIKAMGLDKPEAKQPSIQEKVDANRRSPYYQPSGVGSAPYASVGDFSPAGQKNAFEKMQELKNRLRI